MITKALARFLLRTRWSTLMALFGVTLGVTSIVSVHLVSERVGRQMSELKPGPLATVDFIAERDALTAADYFQLRRAWRRGAYPEIEEMMPLIDETIYLHGRRLRVFGFDMTAVSIGAMGQQIDSEVSDVRGGVWQGKDVPDLGYAVLGELSASELLVADINVAQEILAWQQQDRLSYVGIKAGYGEWLARVDSFAPGFSVGLPQLQNLVVPDWQVLSVADANPAAKFGDAVLFNIGALSLLALVVAWFLIYQVAVFWIRRLTDVFKRLHIMGIHLHTLGLYFVAVLSFLGMFAVVLGVWLGEWVATQLLQAIAGQVMALEVSTVLLFKAAVSAIGVCMVGGSWAFYRAFATTSTPLWANILAIAVLVALFLLGLGLEGSGLIGPFVSIAVASVVLAATMPMFLRLFRHASSGLAGGLLARVSLREVVWFPRDLSVAVSGLSLAIASAIGVGLMVDSFRADFTRMLDRRLSYDYVVDGPVEVLRALQRAATGRADVSRVQAYAEFDVRIDGVAVQILETDVDDYEAARYGFARALGADEALVSEQFDKLGVQEFTVRGVAMHAASVFRGFGDLTPRLVIAGVVTSPGELRINASAVAAETLSASFPDTRWQAQAQMREMAFVTFDATFVITTVLIALAIGVAGTGVYIAITVMSLNQSHTHRLLTFLGLSNTELLLMSVLRGLGVGGVAMLAALPMGLIIGWILCVEVNPRAFGWQIEMALSADALLTPLAWGMAAAIVASVLQVGGLAGESERA